MRQIEKAVLLQGLDHLWREHIVTLDHLRQVVGLRGYAQRDPLVEYKSDGFELFGEMTRRLKELVTRQMMRLEVMAQPPPQPELPPMTAHHFDPLTGEDEMALAGLLFPGGAAAVGQVLGMAAVPAAERDPKDPASWGRIGRNEACPCGSGKKYKHCHGQLV